MSVNSWGIKEKNEWKEYFKAQLKDILLAEMNVTMSVIIVTCQTGI